MELNINTNILYIKRKTSGWLRVCVCARVIADYTYVFLLMILHSIGQKLDNS